MKTLHLSLKKAPFEVMVTGEKTEEFRKCSNWIFSRLVNIDGTLKEYTHVKFVNGYGATKPYFITVFDGFIQTISGGTRLYSNGLKVVYNDGDFILSLGEIIETGNLPNSK